MQPCPSSLDCVYPTAYNEPMIEVRETEVYANWFDRLRDKQAKARINTRVRRLALGNPGDVKPIGRGVQSYVSIMGKAIECISCDAGKP